MPFLDSFNSIMFCHTFYNSYGFADDLVHMKVSFSYIDILNIDLLSIVNIYLPLFHIIFSYWISTTHGTKIWCCNILLLYGNKL